jgi:plastocyanin
MKQVLLLIVLTLALVACGGNGGNGGNRGNNGGGGNEASDNPNVVLMDPTKFIPDAVTIAAGSSVTLDSNAFVPHFIANGTWDGDTAVADREEGAPVMDNVQLKGGEDGTIGPFTESSTFQYYCTIHPGMNLTVTVE